MTYEQKCFVYLNVNCVLFKCIERLNAVPDAMVRSIAINSVGKAIVEYDSGAKTEVDVTPTMIPEPEQQVPVDRELKWIHHTAYHKGVYVNNKKLDWYPTKYKWVYDGTTYIGGDQKLLAFIKRQEQKKWTA